MKNDGQKKGYLLYLEVLMLLYKNNSNEFDLFRGTLENYRYILFKSVEDMYV